MDDRLVRSTIYHGGHGERLGYVWGIMNDDTQEFTVLYTRSARVLEEIAMHESTDIFDAEIENMVDVDDCWTPNIVYVEAAKRALNGDRT